MGFLDAALGALGGNLNQGGNSKEMLLQAAIQMLTSNQGQGGSALQNILGALNNGGLSNIVNSWVSNGQNLPISIEQIKNALGNSGHLAQLADATGVTEDEAASHLSEVLPGIVDHLTPNGAVPEDGMAEVGDLLNKFSSFLK